MNTALQNELEKISQINKQLSDLVDSSKNNHGKLDNISKCSLLRNIRKKMAERNGIIYLEANCNNKKVCEGSCVLTETETKYLENELNNKTKKGERIDLSSLNNYNVDS